MPEVKKEERRISPAIVIIPVALGLAALVGVAALAFAAPEEPPEPPPGLANLYGKVTDAITGYPLLGILVTLNGLEVYTDAAGNYSFESVETGEYLLQFSKAGYETAVY